MSKSRWWVIIRSFETRKQEKAIGPYASEFIAINGDAGVNRNLDHTRFYTTVEKRKESVPKP